MIKEAIGVADTLEEAKESAIEQLGTFADADISFEIIDTPKPKILGLFGGSKAKVRAYVEIAEKTVKKPKQNNNKKNEKISSKKEEKTLKNNTSKSENKEAKSENHKNDFAEPVEASEIDANTPAGKAVAYLLKILKGLSCEDICVKVALGDNCARISLTGESIGVCIGHRGETLDALQYLCSMVASVGGYYRISLDVGNYREKRERTLNSLAHKVASQVLRTGRSRSLEPMNPYERRIIHTVIQEIDGVVSNSVGDGNRRHVVIMPEFSERRRRPQNENRDFSSTENSNREPKSDSGDIPLYGKIK